MAGIISPVVCEQEAAQRPEAKHIFSRAKLEEVIKHWEFKYELLDKYAKDLAVKNKHWEVSWSYHQNMVITRIEQREAVIKGLTQSHQLLVQNNAGFVRAENSWQEVIHQKDSEIMVLKQEKESLSHSASVSTNWQEKYNALKEESSKRLEEKKATNFESVEKDNKSLAERIRKDTAEKREGWASLSKLIKEKFQKIEDKKSHLEEMSTKLLAVKQDILEEEVKVENNLEEKLPQGPAEQQHNGETVMVTEVRKMEDQIKNPEDKSIEDLAETLHSQAEEDTLMKEDQEEKFTEDESTQEVVETPEVEDEEQSTQEVVETPEVEDEQSTQEVVETLEVEEEEKEPEESPDLKQTEAGEAGLQEMESGEETKLSWAAVVANKYKSSKTREKKVEELEEVSDLKQTEAGEEMLQKEKNRNKKKHERRREKALKAMGIIVNEMDSLANIVQSCETSEATDERKEVEEFPDLPKTEAGQVGLQKLESGEENKRSWAAVLKDQSCYTKEKKVEEEVKEPEEVSDPKKTEAQEEVLLKEEQVKEPEEASDPKQTPVEGKLRVGKKSRKDKKKEKKREEYNRSHC
ncbi:golgin subfamily A member 6-like protein 22 isoform X1 [Pseudochaenichthys georgianus]|uniref:golgin subfamily A member 6-like protein 22 isoform X1 n=1 Tax=Pseudochaenichthys georgianus TaxID=52239 RepID=UPI00146BC8C4|nr:ABC transporter F family member 4-like [Pseudochaenichthys georgianus]